ncbi:MAG TPA: OsmC family protein [Bacteroidales bacterium]|nr:OsmC family protein [Bacteroidales bacterium]HRZ48146.1 OsmC family protein [Bacteroidales bacterium]
MTDKSKELKTTVTLMNNRLHFNGMVEGNAPISIDYTPPLGDNLGYTSLELLLLSLSSCLGSALLTFLRRMDKHIINFTIHSTGFRKESHPTSFSRILLEVEVTSSGITEAELKKLTRMAEETYCPVWDMIRGNVTVDVNFNIIIR